MIASSVRIARGRCGAGAKEREKWAELPAWPTRARGLAAAQRTEALLEGAAEASIAARPEERRCPGCGTAGAASDGEKRDGRKRCRCKKKCGRTFGAAAGTFPLRRKDKRLKSWEAGEFGKKGRGSALRFRPPGATGSGGSGASAGEVARDRPASLSSGELQGKANLSRSLRRSGGEASKPDLPGEQVPVAAERGGAAFGRSLPGTSADALAKASVLTPRQAMRLGVEVLNQSKGLRRRLVAALPFHA